MIKVTAHKSDILNGEYNYYSIFYIHFIINHKGFQHTKTYIIWIFYAIFVRVQSFIGEDLKFVLMLNECTLSKSICIYSHLCFSKGVCMTTSFALYFANTICSTLHIYLLLFSLMAMLDNIMYPRHYCLWWTHVNTLLLCDSM